MAALCGSLLADKLVERQTGKTNCLLTLWWLVDRGKF